MDNSVEERIFQTIHRFRKLVINSKCIGEMPRSEIMMLKLIRKSNARGEKITISELSGHLEVSKPAVSQMINTLEEKGFVERHTTKNDRRNVYVRLTAAGEESLDKALKEYLKSLHQAFEKMGKEDTETLLHLMEKLYNIMSSDNNK